MTYFTYLRAGALGAACSGMLVACLFETSGERPFGWNVRFLCNADRAVSDRLRIVVRKDGCAGKPLYDELLESGDQPSEMPALEAGSYGFEAVALSQGTTVASTCIQQKLPSTFPRVTLELASDTCTTPDNIEDQDSGTSVSTGDAAAIFADGGVSTPTRDAAATGDDAATPVIDPPVYVDPCPPEAAAAGTCVPCTRSCGSGQACQNDACLPLDSVSDGCTAQRRGEHDYLFCTNAITWDSARNRCRDWGLGLVVIDDAEENAFVHTLAAGQDVWTAANDFGPSDIGVGGLDIQLTEGSFGSDTPSCKKVDGTIGEGNWYWASPTSNVSNDASLCAFADVSATTCTPSAGTYQNFNAGEPDNANCTCLGVCLPGEDCGLMLGATGMWSDRGCLRPSAFVCEGR